MMKNSHLPMSFGKVCAAAAVVFCVLFSFSARAQVYRCGDTFSDSPCADDAKEYTVFGEGAESHSNLDEKAAQTCLAAIRSQGLLGNPGGATVVPAGKRKSQVTELAGGKFMGFHLPVAISEINPTTGAYLPPRQFDCVLSPDLLRVFSVQVVGAGKQE